MLYYTEIERPEYPFKITYRDSLFWIGSCFTANLGNIMKSLRFRAEVNPFGALYNPASILKALEILLSKRELQPDDLFEHEELWSSYIFHGSFSGTDKMQVLQNMNRQITKASESLYLSQYIFITFGTAYVYRLKTSGEIAGNCHKLPSSNFEYDCLDVEEIVASYSEFIAQLSERLPNLKIIFTLSPVRHFKDGAHNNQRSKAILLLGIDKLTDAFPDRCFYFPVYEIVLDELRDYRFYEKDMCHVSALGIEHIKNIFVNALIDKQDREIIKEIENLNTARSHRPFHTDTSQYKQFVENTDKKELLLKSKYPHLFGEN